MKQFIVKLIVVAVMLLALLLPVAGAGNAHALVACQPLLHFPCTGGGVICVDKHGHVKRHIKPQWHCIAI